MNNGGQKNGNGYGEMNGGYSGPGGKVYKRFNEY